MRQNTPLKVIKILIVNSGLFCTINNVFREMEKLF